MAGDVTRAYLVACGTSYNYGYDYNNRLENVYDGTTGSTHKAAYAYDALGRRIEFIDHHLGTTTRYYYDGVNQIVETNAGGTIRRYYVHGVSYIDERLMMRNYYDQLTTEDDRSYYYTLDRMYNVRGIIDRAAGRDFCGSANETLDHGTRRQGQAVFWIPARLRSGF